MIKELRIERCGLQGLERSEPCGDEALQFQMEADPGKDIHARGCIRSGKKGNASGV